jgi:hypothetical protein
MLKSKENIWKYTFFKYIFIIFWTFYHVLKYVLFFSLLKISMLEACREINMESGV